MLLIASSMESISPIALLTAYCKTDKSRALFFTESLISFQSSTFSFTSTTVSLKFPENENFLRNFEAFWLFLLWRNTFDFEKRKKHFASEFFVVLMQIVKRIPVGKVNCSNLEVKLAAFPTRISNRILYVREAYNNKNSLNTFIRILVKKHPASPNTW